MRIETSFCEFDYTPETFGAVACAYYEAQIKAASGNPSYTASNDVLWAWMRRVRNALLDMIDTRYFNADKSQNMTGQEKQALRDVKQALKDLPTTYPNPRQAQLPATMPNGTYTVL